MSHLYKYSLLLSGLALVACRKDATPAVAPLTFTTVSTLAGTGQDGYTDGPGATAQLSDPEGLTTDAQGNVYVADAGNACIRKITPAGVVSTFAGTGRSGYQDGPAATATFGAPMDVAFDSKGNLFVADGANNCIRKITPAGVVSTFAGTGAAGFADGSPTQARFRFPDGLAINAQDVLYVADYENGSLRRIDPSGTVTTLAGNGLKGYANGTGNQVQFQGPEGLALDQQGNIYVADYMGYRVRKVTPGGVASTLAGTGVSGTANGPASSAQLGSAAGVAVDAAGTVYVAESNSHSIRRIATDGTVSTLAGTGQPGSTDGPVGTARFDIPSGLALDASGNLLVTEYGQHVRKISAR